MEHPQPRSREEQQAWDLFAAAALAGAMPDGGQFGGVAERAAREADKLLELRRARLEADRQAALNAGPTT
jgi:hypothetical protein